MTATARILTAVLLLAACACGQTAAKGAPDGGPDAGSGSGGDAGSPITATPGSWTWVDFPNSSCDDGTPTGVGVNTSASSSNLLVFFNGGGACWDYQTCYQLNLAVHGPYGNAQFQQQFGGAGPAGSLLDRALANSPFADWNLVFVPYCTGDVHAGDNVITYTKGTISKVTHHTGHANLLAYLARLGATFAAPGKVVVSGSSAGGFGALLNYDSLRKAWPAASVYLIDDSGPVLEGNAIPAAIRAAWFSSWNLAGIVDPLCGAACHDDLSLAYPKLAQRYPNDRMSLLSFEQDQVIRSYFFLSATDFQTDLLALASDKFDPVSRWHYFFLSGQSHTMLGGPASHMQNGVSLVTFLKQQVTDDPFWATQKP